jgi:phosphomannomutase
MLKKIFFYFLIFNVLATNSFSQVSKNVSSKLSLTSKISQENIRLIKTGNIRSSEQTTFETLFNHFSTVQKYMIMYQNIGINLTDCLSFIYNNKKLLDKVKNLDEKMGFTNDISLFNPFSKNYKKGVKSVIIENLIYLTDFEILKLERALDSKDYLLIYQTLIELFGEKILDAHMRIRGGELKKIRDIINTNLVFGTSGWRDQIGLGFNPFLVSIIFDSLGEYYKADLANTDKYFIIGFDTREFGPESVELATRILESKGIKVLVPFNDGMHVSTPQIAFFVQRKKILLRGKTYKIGGGAYITASHNPSQDNGIKGFSKEGNAAPIDMTREVDDFNRKFIAKIKNRKGFGQFKRPEDIREGVDKVLYTDSEISEPYIEFLMSTLNIEAIKELVLSGRAFFDVSNGSAREAVRRLLLKIGVPKEEVLYYILNTKMYIPEGYHPNPDYRYSGTALLKSLGLVIQTKENDIKIDFTKLTNEQLSNLVDNKKEITVGGHKIKMDDSEISIVENIKKLAQGESITIFVDGKKRIIRKVAQKPSIVVKMDADCDRISGQIGGEFLDANSIGALLTDYHIEQMFLVLKNKTMSKEEFYQKYGRFIEDGKLNIMVGRTIASTELVDSIMKYWEKVFNNELAEENLKYFGISEIIFEVDEVPVGFKNFAKKDKEYLVFFESSSHIADFLTGVETKDDGLAIGLRLVEIQAKKNKSLVEYVQTIRAKVGYEKEFLELALVYKNSSQYDLVKDSLKNNIEKMKVEAQLIAEQLNLKIKEIRTNGGFKIIFEDGSSLLIRVSGTELKGRIYIQAEKSKIELFEKMGYFMLKKDRASAIELFVSENAVLKKYEKIIVGFFKKFIKQDDVNVVRIVSYFQSV